MINTCNEYQKRHGKRHSLRYLKSDQRLFSPCTQGIKFITFKNTDVLKIESYLLIIRYRVTLIMTERFQKQGYEMASIQTYIKKAPSTSIKFITAPSQVYLRYDPASQSLLILSLRYDAQRYVHHALPLSNQ